MKFTPLTNTSMTLADKAYQSIRDAIVTLELKPGQLIYETDIANSLGVSRTPVREAFRQLKSSQLIEILPQKGIRIVLISIRKVEEARFVRESLEISSFREVTRQWDSNNEKCIQLSIKTRETLNRQEEEIKRNDYVAFLKCDEAFHNNILNFINNKTLMDVVSHMKDHLNRVRYLELQEMKHMKALLCQHETLFEAITQNDEDMVVKLLLEHFRKFQFTDALEHKYQEYFEFDK